MLYTKDVVSKLRTSKSLQKCPLVFDNAKVKLAFLSGTEGCIVAP